jgi:soluble cytochrome b562
MKSNIDNRTAARATRRPTWRAIAWISGVSLLSFGAMSANQDGGDSSAASAPTTLEETRLTMGKWIETQQIISKERKDWQQGKEILAGRVDLVKQEIATLETKIKEAQSSVDAADAKHGELLEAQKKLEAIDATLADAVGGMEQQVRRLMKQVPEPIRTKLEPLFQRIPEDSTKAKVSVAERFQNVLGILNELNKAATDLTINYEVRNLADGKPAEVRVIYIGLTQAYYVSSGGEAGVGRPGPEGWTWEPSKTIANDVSMALDIQQGKQTPAFVPLPAKLQ